MYVVAAQIIAQALVPVVVAEVVVVAVQVVQEGVLLLVLPVAQVAAKVVAREAVLEHVLADVLEVAKVRVATHVQVVLEDVWAIALENVQELAKALVLLPVGDGIIINHGF